MAQVALPGPGLPFLQGSTTASETSGRAGNLCGRPPR